MFIKRINRISTANVFKKDASIICPVCKSESNVISRRNTKWITFCFIEIVEIQKCKAYPAYSHCLNGLPEEFSICKGCKRILNNDKTLCEHCQTAEEKSTVVNESSAEPLNGKQENILESQRKIYCSTIHIGGGL